MQNTAMAVTKAEKLVVTSKFELIKLLDKLIATGTIDFQKVLRLM